MVWNCNLVKYWFPRVINYKYETVETPYQFEYNLTNKNISTTKNKQNACLHFHHSVPPNLSPTQFKGLLII